MWTKSSSRQGDGGEQAGVAVRPRSPLKQVSGMKLTHERAPISDCHDPSNQHEVLGVYEPKPIVLEREDTELLLYAAPSTGEDTENCSGFEISLLDSTRAEDDPKFVSVPNCLETAPEQEKEKSVWDSLPIAVETHIMEIESMLTSSELTVILLESALEKTAGINGVLSLDLNQAKNELKESRQTIVHLNELLAFQDGKKPTCEASQASTYLNSESEDFEAYSHDGWPSDDVPHEVGGSDDEELDPADDTKVGIQAKLAKLEATLLISGHHEALEQVCDLKTAISLIATGERQEKACSKMELAERENMQEQIKKLQEDRVHLEQQLLLVSEKECSRPAVTSPVAVVGQQTRGKSARSSTARERIISRYEDRLRDQEHAFEMRKHIFRQICEQAERDAAQMHEKLVYAKVDLATLSHEFDKYRLQSRVSRTHNRGFKTPDPRESTRISMYMSPSRQRDIERRRQTRSKTPRRGKW